MIENVNASKNPANGEYLDIRKYIGVASVNVLSVNPSNNTLRKYGWQIPEDAPEPSYVIVKDDGGKPVKNARVRFLVQVQDLEDKPVVALDFWCRPEVMMNKEGTKCKIIDAYGRTAWGTKDEVTNKKVPVYKDGNEANISTPYKLCHPGEEELVQFLFKYLNITPLQIFSREKKTWITSKNPGRLTIDNWNSICSGDTAEIARYLALQPENRVKVILGLRTTEDNKTYQTFLNTTYIGNGAVPDRNTGEYQSARKAIDRYFEGREDSPYSFSATPVKEWRETATVVEESRGVMFDDEGNFVADKDDSDNFPF